jgi:predicted nuclease of predicted toxin-antitoxin system
VGRFLADENIPVDAVDGLRSAGHDVLWITTGFAGLTDQAVLAKAVEDQRVLLTFDKDFGELVFRGSRPACGVVLFRTGPATAGALVTLVLTVIASATDWIGHFSVVKGSRLRRVPLPPTLR